MSSEEIEVNALALNVGIPTELRWRDERRGVAFELQSLTVRLLPDGTFAAKAYGRPVDGGRGTYVSFPVRESPEITELIIGAARRAGQRWADARP
ncbi:hypothetical protein [Microbacterium sp.]|uniref:hypothetical protein n=1 Tax=Microbacterium sp. TaxID=51671 RepID=UPI00333FC730